MDIGFARGRSVEEMVGSRMVYSVLNRNSHGLLDDITFCAKYELHEHNGPSCIVVSLGLKS